MLKTESIYFILSYQVSISLISFQISDSDGGSYESLQWGAEGTGLHWGHKWGLENILQRMRPCQILTPAHYSHDSVSQICLLQQFLCLLSIQI